MYKRVTGISRQVCKLAHGSPVLLGFSGRELRYRFLFRVAGEHGAQAVAVGHNADDQVETFLMHLLRGAGLPGLKGMQFRTLPNPWSEEIPLVRPLLSVWREEITQYNTKRELEPLQDLSNFDTTYFRNRLRHELIPFLQDYNPAIKKVLWRTADVLRGDFEVLSRATSRAWSNAVLEQYLDSVSFAVEALKNLPVGLQRLVFLHAIGQLRPDLRDVGFDAVERALKFLNSPTQTGRADLIGGLYLLLEVDQLWLADWKGNLPVGDWPWTSTEQEMPVQVPSSLGIGGSWRLIVEQAEDAGEEIKRALENRDAYRAWVDPDSLQAPLTVRTRRPGDRFEPLGMEGHSVKLSDFMINEKIPQRARSTWPVLVSGDRIVWVPGLRLGEPFKLRKDSTRAIRLQLGKNSER
jgi:tRNA(Ile)-lysidine synthase